MIILLRCEQDETGRRDTFRHSNSWRTLMRCTLLSWGLYRPRVFPLQASGIRTLLCLERRAILAVIEVKSVDEIVQLQTFRDR